MIMSILNATLLGFALWTLAVLAFTVGVHRWSRILTGKAGMHEFPADAPSGPDWYKRATRAHANCVENLPVFAAIVVVANAVGAASPYLDALGVVILCARLAQTTTHVGFVQTARAVSIRFTFFSVQLVAMIAMAVIVLAGMLR
jgi:uncharacterized membrane protein YecN with MAPEG domain